LEAKKVEKKKRSDVNEKLQTIKKTIEKTENKSIAYLKRKEVRKEQEVSWFEKSKNFLIYHINYHY